MRTNTACKISCSPNSQPPPVPTQAHSGLLLCRRGQAGDKLWNAAAAPCNFSGYRESAGPWLELDYPSPLLRVSSQRHSVRVLSLLIALERLFNVAWYLQPGIVPTEMVFMCIAVRSKNPSNIDHADHRLVSDVNAVVWTPCPLQKCWFGMSCFQSSFDF